MKTLPEMIAVMQAAERGERIEIADLTANGPKNWRDTDCPQIGWNWCEFQYRIKPSPPRPQPWSAEDVPPVCWLRFPKTNNHHTLAIRIAGDGVVHDWNGTTMLSSWIKLARQAEHSTDLKVWKPCTK